MCWQHLSMSGPELLQCMAQDQTNSDGTLDDVACMLGCTRSSLHGAPQAPFLARELGVTPPVLRHCLSTVAPVDVSMP